MIELNCYKCKSTKNLLVQEKIDPKSGKAFDKKFICLDCAGGANKVLGK